MGVSRPNVTAALNRSVFIRCFARSGSARTAAALGEYRASACLKAPLTISAFSRVRAADPLIRINARNKCHGAAYIVLLSAPLQIVSRECRVKSSGGFNPTGDDVAYTTHPGNSHFVWTTGPRSPALLRALRHRRCGLSGTTNSVISHQVWLGL